jgi:hypothetical protein
MPNRFPLLQIVASCFLLLPVPAPAADSTAAETWYVVKIAGSPVGFASETTLVGEKTIVVRSHTDLSMKRMGTPLTMFMLSEEVSDAEGNFQRGSMEMTASITGARTEAVLRGDEVEVTFETGGNSETRSIPWDDEAVSQYQAHRLSDEWLRSDLPELRYRVFDINNGEFKDMRAVRGDRSAGTIGGREVELLSVVEYEGDSEVPVSTTFYGPDNEALRTVIVQMGMEIVVERITEEEMADIELEPSFDIIRQSMIECDGYPDPPSEVESVTMELDFPHPLAADREFDGPNQKVTRRGDDWVEMAISRETLNRMTENQEALGTWLEPGKYIQSDHERVRAVADSIATATGATGWELARELAAWVNGYMNRKGFEQGFASALESLETRSGDCTEHSVLLTALLRAAGIPARPAVGLAYANGSFIGHMWTEAYVDYWRTLDALDLSTDPIRVRVTAARTSEAVDERGLVQAYAVVGGMHARVTSFTRR